MSKTPVGKKDLSSKLAGAVRAARTEQAMVVAPGVLPPSTSLRTGPATLAHPRASEAVKPVKPPAVRPRARQSSPDDQQHQMHPERIWPD